MPRAAPAAILLHEAQQQALHAAQVLPRQQADAAPVVVRVPRRHGVVFPFPFVVTFYVVVGDGVDVIMGVRGGFAVGVGADGGE